MYCFAFDQFSQEIPDCSSNVIHFIRQRYQKGDFEEENSIEFSVVTLLRKVKLLNKC